MAKPESVRPAVARGKFDESGANHSPSTAKAVDTARSSRSGRLKDGVIADFEITENMLRHLIQKTHNRRFLARPRIVICVPSGITSVEKRAVRASAEAADAHEVYLIEEPADPMVILISSAVRSPISKLYLR